MNLTRWVASLVCLAAVGSGTAWGGPVRLSFGVGIGVPAYHHHHQPCYYAPSYGYHYYRPYPVYVERPVLVQPAPVVIEQPVLVQPAVQPVWQAPVPRVEPPVVSAPAPANAVNIQPQLQQLASTDERARADAALELGRLRADAAVDRLAATLAGDQSPAVRDSAARALGLIGSPRSLTVLTHSAQADGDRDVRRSAQFAVEVIQTHQRR